MKKLEWGTDGQAMLRDLDELDTVLDRLDRHARETQPFIVELFTEAGDSLSMGVGRPVSVLNFVPASGGPPYFRSRGTAQDNGSEGIVFLYRGEWSEYPPENAISAETARTALRQFFTTEQLPDNVDWQEV